MSAALLRGAAWLAAAVVAVRGLDAALESRPLVAILLGAIAVDFARAQIGVRDAGDPSARARALRAWLGARAGLSAGLLPLLVGAALRQADLRLVAPSPLGLGAGALRVAVLAFRDEMLDRGMPLALASLAGVPLGPTLAFVAVLDAAPLVGVGAAPPAIAAAAAGAVLFALAWRRAGAFAAWGAHAAWLLAVDVIPRGLPIDARWRSGVLAPLAHASGTPAWLAAGSLALAALLMLPSRTDPPR